MTKRLNRPRSELRRVRRVPVEAFIDPEGFRLARGRALMSQEAAAAFLGVTGRTIRNWEQGRAKIPYAAFKLLRCYSGFELPHPSWAGFTFHKETLWSPDLRAYRADDLAQLGNIVTMARFWHQDYERRRPAPAPLPSSNVVPFPRAGRRAVAAPEAESGSEERGSGWLPGVVRRWF
ncbi:MAG: VC1465 family Xer recombination activation factor, partial [Pseudomonadota bacterium]